MSSQKRENKILFIAPDPNAGGSTKAILPVLKDLIRYGYRLVVIIPSEGYFSQTLKSIGIEYQINPYIKPCLWPKVHNLKDLCLFLPWSFYKMVKLFVGYRKVLNYVELFNPNLIYTNSSLVLQGYLVAKKRHIPHIWHIHEYGDKDFGEFNFPSNRFKIKRLSNTPSISITKQIHEHYHLNKNSGVIIYNGIKSLKYFTTYKDNNIFHKKYILFVGHITEMKGVTDLINAFLLYCKQEGKLDLIMCGSIDEDYKTSLMSMISESPFLNRISFVGQVDNVDNYMIQAEAIIIPSKYEAFGLVTSEAMFNHCLIIGRNTGGTKEQLDLGLNQTGHEIGLRFTTIEELTSQIHKVESMNHAEMNSYILPAYQTAIRNFTTENYTSRVREYIDYVIKKDISQLDKN